MYFIYIHNNYVVCMQLKVSMLLILNNFSPVFFTGMLHFLFEYIATMDENRYRKYGISFSKCFIFMV